MPPSRPRPPSVQWLSRDASRGQPVKRGGLRMLAGSIACQQWSACLVFEACAALPPLPRLQEAPPAPPPPLPPHLSCSSWQAATAARRRIATQPVSERCAGGPGPARGAIHPRRRGPAGRRRPRPPQVRLWRPFSRALALVGVACQPAGICQDCAVARPSPLPPHPTRAPFEWPASQGICTLYLVPLLLLLTCCSAAPPCRARCIVEPFPWLHALLAAIERGAAIECFLQGAMRRRPPAGRPLLLAVGTLRCWQKLCRSAVSQTLYYLVLVPVFPGLLAGITTPTPFKRWPATLARHL